MRHDETVDTLIVTYTVKELLHDMQQSLARIDAKLDTKAEQAELDTLTGRVVALEMSRAKALGAMALMSFLAGGGGYVVAAFTGGA